MEGSLTTESRNEPACLNAVRTAAAHVGPPGAGRPRRLLLPQESSQDPGPPAPPRGAGPLWSRTGRAWEVGRG
jgi:hypothetical protein